MSQCSHELRRLGQPYPRTCQMCGLGPCKREPATVRYTGTLDLAAQIADVVFPHSLDRLRRDQLTVLLGTFAEEIERNAIET